MTAKPFKVCAKAGCNALTKDRYCSKHKNERNSHDKYRPNANARGYDYQWSKVRKLHLNANPLCVFCLDAGKVTEATDVDHIKSLADYPELKTDPNNLRSLCHSCHSRRTWRDQGLGKELF